MNQRHVDNCTALAVGIVSGVPTLLWGPPGQGKTSIINAIARQYSLHLETIIAAIREPSDFAGLPIVDSVTKTVSLAAPSWAQRLVDHEGGMAFYDEISTAPPATQAALLRPILEGWVGDVKLPDGVRTVAAANPADIAAGGWDLAAPLANRFLHLNWTLEADVIRDGFSTGWGEVELPQPDPEKVDALFREAKILVGAFIGARPELATRLPDSSDEAGRAWPSPRSWEQVAKLYAFANACDPRLVNSNVVQMLVTGSVGVAAAGEFIAYVAQMDLPDPEDLLNDPESFRAPSDRGNKMYAICASVYSAVANNLTPERWINCGTILAKIADGGGADIAFSTGQKWTGIRPANAMPTSETVAALGPVLQELGRLSRS